MLLKACSNVNDLGIHLAKNNIKEKKFSSAIKKNNSETSLSGVWLHSPVGRKKSLLLYQVTPTSMQLDSRFLIDCEKKN